MNIEFTALIVSQAKTLIVMACAGILTGVVWESKRIIQKKLSILLDEEQRYFRILATKYIIEVVFWIVITVIISNFLYYCAYGKPSVHAAAGFFTGLLLCRKKCCDIIKTVWVENEEAESSKTTARSLALMRPENKGWTKGGQRRKKKKKK